MKRLHALILAVVMCFSMLPVAQASELSDVPENAVYADAVRWAVDQELMPCFADGTFRPRSILTRAEMVSILWREAGQPVPAIRENPFKDITPLMDCYTAVLWAYEAGITAGRTATTFDPSAPCTHAEVLTFLWHTEGSPAALEASDLAAANAETYYTHALAWADVGGVVEVDAEHFVANLPASRADIANYLYQMSLQQIAEEAPLAGAGQLLISQQPKSQEPSSGMVSFTVQASGGQAPYTYNWESKTGSGSWFRVYDTTSNTLNKFPAASMITSGLYFRCVVSDAAGNKVTSDEAKVLQPGEAFSGSGSGSSSAGGGSTGGSASVSGPLTVKTHPKDATASSGAPVTFKVEVTGGKTPYSYKWESKNSATDWTRSYDSTSATLTKYPSASMISSGLMFRCVITDAVGNKVTTNAARVLEANGTFPDGGSAGGSASVGGPLTIKTQPTDAEQFNEDTQLIYKVEVTGGKAPYHYRWEYSNKFLDWDHVFESPSSDTLVTTTLAMAGYNDRYRCVITDSEGTQVISEEAGIIYVGDDPSFGPLYISDQPVGVGCYPGDTVRVYIRTDGGTKPHEYLWEYKTNNSNWTKFDGGSLRSDVYLTPTQYELEHDIQVRCTVTDADGNTVTSDTARVTKLDTPQDGTLKITSQPKAATGSDYSVGDSVQFSVTVSGGAAPYRYQWQIADKTNTSAYEGFQDIDDPWYGWAYGHTTSQLSVIFEEVMISDDALFCCVITDALGNTVTTKPVGFADAYTGPRVVSQPGLCIYNRKYYDPDINETSWVDYTVEVEGGVEPYTYQWEYRPQSKTEVDREKIAPVVFSSADSSWASGFNTDTLTALVFTPIEYSYEHARYYMSPGFRCKITAADGQFIYTEWGNSIVYDHKG